MPKVIQTNSLMKGLKYYFASPILKSTILKKSTYIIGKLENYSMHYLSLKYQEQYNTMSASRNKTSHLEAYTSLLKVYQEANLAKKRDIAIREAQDMWNELKDNKDLLKKKIELLKLEGEEKNGKHMEEQAQASSSTIAENTTEDITENTTKDMSKRRETPAQTKLKEELIQLNRELSQLQNLEDKGALVTIMRFWAKLCFAYVMLKIGSLCASHRIA
ncbi:hypothetical protein C2G38_2044790 [Gigaspora rosea]|uniref:Uncharacterized protein n=1 Tax=Gigaspora rosea TaxID=44941 RepID=A0A397UFC9_9GLOM|nr:hypothetical protein C2G38_2044790 [Gigaspora rosea]